MRLDPVALERLDRFLDARAGEHALTDEERWVRRVCRERFGLFAPDLPAQHWWLNGARLLLDPMETETPPVATPDPPASPLPVEAPLAEYGESPWAEYGESPWAEYGDRWR